MKSGSVNSGHVACTRWLVLFRLETEGVNVDTSGWNVFVVLVWLDKVEVSTFSLGESVVAVKLELSSENRVDTLVVSFVLGT